MTPCHALSLTQRDPIDALEPRLRPWVVLALNAPQGGAVHQQALIGLRKVILDTQGFECVERGARHAALGLRIRSLLLILAHAEGTQAPGALSSRVRTPEQGRAVAELVEAACWSLVDRLTGRSPRWACEALIELVRTASEFDASPAGRGVATARIWSLGEQAQRRLEAQLAEWSQRDARACA